jgi:hypothetical protein
VTIGLSCLASLSTSTWTTFTPGQFKGLLYRPIDEVLPHGGYIQAPLIAPVNPLIPEYTPGQAGFGNTSCSGTAEPETSIRTVGGHQHLALPCHASAARTHSESVQLARPLCAAMFSFGRKVDVEAAGHGNSPQSSHNVNSLPRTTP